MWESARQLAAQGKFDEIPAQLFIPHMRNFQLIYKEARGKVSPIEDFNLKVWQEDLLNILLSPPDKRKILWYWEEVGNVGKSWMATFLLRNHGATTISTGKTADIAYLLDKPTIVVFDISRAQGMEHINFGVMEDIKNGRIFSPKYESAIKAFDTPHIVVFANEPCPAGKFSADRLHSVRIGEEVNVYRDAAYAPGFIPPYERSFNFDFLPANARIEDIDEHMANFANQRESQIEIQEMETDLSLVNSFR